MGPNIPATPTRGSDSRTRPGARRGFALLSPAFLDELRVRVTLSQLIGRTVPLKKAGNEFKACCPFHNEKTPSFWVNDQKGFYHCFGCGVHGDAIRWLTEARGMVFLDAVRQLADEVGLILPKPEPEELARQERAAGQQEILEAATRYFQSMLIQNDGEAARDYLRLREIGGSSISDFRIGYAPEGRLNLRGALSQFTPEQLVEAGLLISVDDKEPYDRFRNRIMVPIKDPRGRVVAFGGRILGDGEPKYLNSPDTFLFDKGRVLFNLDRAAPASRQANRIIVVEGYFDVIALDGVGIREAVAPMGTALTESQLEQLWRLSDEPILCFDGDSAGLKAAERAAQRAMPSLRPGKQLRIVILPAGQDPDDVIRRSGAEAFEAAVESALPLSTFLYRSELQKIDPTRPEKRAELRRHLEDIAQSCADRFVAEEFTRSLRELFFDDFGWKARQRKDIRIASIRTSGRVRPDLARDYVRSMLHGLTRFPAVAQANLEAIATIPMTQPDFCRWRDAISEAVILKPDLEEDGIRTIIAADLLPEVLQFDIRHDLRFGFMRRMTDPGQAVKQLETLVTFLSQGREIDENLAALNQAATTDAGGPEYGRIEELRQDVRRERVSLFQQSADWNGELG